MDNKICLALGFFDSVHIGHRKIIASLKDISLKSKATPCAMTFKNNIYGIVKSGSKLIYTFEEREKIFDRLGIKPIAFEFTSEFCNTDRESFLEMLVGEYDIQAFVCGRDFTFGKNRAGNAEYLRDYSKKKNILAIIEDDVCISGDRISTTLIKQYLSNGKNLENANKLLGEDYSVSGTVIGGMGRGKSLGFPTANVSIPHEKFLIGEGVYSTDTIVDGIVYKSITNIGPKPTFSEETSTIETYLIGYNGNLYGKEITLVFRRFMRDIIRFSDKNKLINQLEEDKKTRCSE